MCGVFFVYSGCMKQVLVIHGGTSYDSYDSYINDLQASQLSYERMKRQSKWKEWLAEALPDTDVLLPDFPNKQNAQYEEWVIQFEKIIPYLQSNAVVIGYSLGAMFLAQYLHANVLPVTVSKIILIAPTYDDDTNEQLGSFKVASAVGLERSAAEVHLMHSEDDPVSPFAELQKFIDDLPTAHVHIFEDRSHFFQATFPELVEIIQ